MSASRRYGAATSGAATSGRENRRLAVSYGLLALVLMLIVSATASFAFLRLQSEEEDKLAGTITAILSDSISRVSFSGKYQTRLLVEEMATHVNDLAYISVEDLQGRIVANSNPALDDTLVSAAGVSRPAHPYWPCAARGPMSSRR
jgi:hypothetical protein